MPANPDRSSSPEQPGKKRPRWLLIVIGVLVLLFLLVLLGPTIASMGIAASIVEGKASKQIHGNVKIDGLSIGWFSGLRLKGTQVFDDKGTLVLTVDELDTPITILRAMRGDWRIGPTTGTITINRFDCFEDGSTTLDHLLGTQPKAAHAHHAANATEAAPASPASKLPDVNGNVVINLTGNIYQEGVEKPLVISPGTQATIDIPSINGAITNDIQLVLAGAQGGTGTVSIKGDTTAVQNNVVQIDALKAHQDVVLTNLDLPTLMPVVKELVPALDYELPSGVQSGTLSLTADGMNNVQLVGNLRTDQAALSGGALREPDVVKFNDIVVPIKASLAPGADGKVDVDAQIDVLLDDGQTGKVTITAKGPQNTLTEAAALVPDALRTLAPTKGHHKTESATVEGQGGITVSAWVDLAKLAPMLKNTLALDADVTSGKATSDTTVAVKDDSATISSNSRIEMNGMRAGTAVQLHPIEVLVAATATGGDMPQINDLSLKMNCAFLQAQVTGKSLAAVQASGQADLAAMNSELSQFMDLSAMLGGAPAGTTAKPMTLAGKFDFQASSNGDFNQPGSAIPVTASLSGTDIAVEGVGNAPASHISRIAADFSTQLRRGTAGEAFLTDAKNLTINIHGGSDQSPDLTLTQTADIDLVNLSAPQWKTTFAVPDLKRLQDQYGALMPTLHQMGIDLTSGAIAAQAGGSYDGKTLTFAQPATFQVQQLSVVKHDADGRSADLFSQENLTGTAQGSITLAGGLGATFDQLSLTSSSGLVSVQKSTAEPFSLRMDEKAGASGGGELKLTADAKRLVDLYDAYAGSLPGAGDAKIDSGAVDATIDVRQAATGTTLTVDGKLANLTVTRAGAAVVSGQTLNLAANLAAAPNNSKLTGSLSFGGDLAQLTVDQLDVEMTDAATGKPVGTMDMLRSAHLAASAPDFGKAWSLLDAIRPKAAAPAEPAPAAMAPISEQYASAARVDPPADGGTTDQPAPAPAPKKKKKKHPATAAASQPEPQAEAPATPAAPLAPLQVLGGAGTLDVSVKRDVTAHTTSLSGNARLSQVAFARGQQRYAFDAGKDISLNFAADIDAQTTAAPTTGPATRAASDDWDADGAAPTLQPAAGTQLNALRFTTLDGDLGGLAKLSMPSPLTVTSPLHGPTASGKIQIDGDLGPARPLVAVLTGNDLPATGTFSMYQELSTAGDSIKMVGQGDLNNLTILKKDKPAASEQKITIVNDLAANLERDDLELANLSVDFAQSQAMTVKASGKITDWSVHRDLNLTADVGYDLAKIYVLVQPLLSDSTQAQMEGATVGGQHQSHIVLGGAYPAEDHLHRPLPFGKSIKAVVLSGDLAVGTLTLPKSGADIENLAVPLSMKNGIATLVYADKPDGQNMPTPGAFNTGTIDLGGFAVDLTGPEPRFTSPKNKAVIGSAALNPVLAQTCGKLVGSLFATANDARGYLDVNIDHADGVALGDALKTKHSGSAKVIFSLRDMNITNPMGSLLKTEVLGKLPGGLGGGSDQSSDSTQSQSDLFRGQIKNATLELSQGVVTSNIPLALTDAPTSQTPAAGAGAADQNNPAPAAGQAAGAPAAGGAQQPAPMNFSIAGTVRLSDQTQNMNLTLPPQFFGRWFGGKSQVEQTLETAFPEGIPVVLGGTTSNPTVKVGDIGKKFLQAQADQLLKGGGSGGSGGLQNSLQQLLGGKKKNKQQQQQPAGQPTDNGNGF